MEKIENLKNCTVGLELKQLCYKKSYVRSVGLKQLIDYSLEDQELLAWRSGVEIHTICLHHEHMFLNRYADSNSNCCNPFQIHSQKQKRKKGNILIDLFKKYILYYSWVPNKRIYIIKVCIIHTHLISTPSHTTYLNLPKFLTPSVLEIKEYTVGFHFLFIDLLIWNIMF